MLTVYAIEKSEIYGHGTRAVIWFSGCTLCCPGCVNQNMWDKTSGKPMTVEQVLRMIALYEGITGVTYIGGEPLQQGRELLILSEKIRILGLDIVLFTGYEEHEFSDVQIVVAECASVLIVGRYMESQRDTTLLLRGSRNQKIIVKDKSLLPFYTQECRQVEIWIDRDTDKFLGFPEDFL